MAKGFITDIDTAKRRLLENSYNRYGQQTFKSAYSNIMDNYNYMSSQLQNVYSGQTSDAYNTYLSNLGAISSSGVVGGGLTNALRNEQSALEQAYNTYRSNYLQDESKLQESVNESISAIDKELEDYAIIQDKLTQAHYGMLEELWNRYGENYGIPPVREYYSSEEEYNKAKEQYDKVNLFGNRNWEKYLTKDLDTGDMRLKTWDELTTATWDTIVDKEGNVIKQYNSLYDENGELTDAGIDFFEQMENDALLSDLYKFSDYLKETDEELYDYWTKEDAYNWTPVGGQGTFKELYGIDPTDYVYSFAERMGGFTDNQLTALFNEQQNFVSEVKRLWNDIETNSAKLTTDGYEYDSSTGKYYSPVSVGTTGTSTKLSGVHMGKVDGKDVYFNSETGKLYTKESVTEYNSLGVPESKTKITELSNDVLPDNLYIKDGKLYTKRYANDKDLYEGGNRKKQKKAMDAMAKYINENVDKQMDDMYEIYRDLGIDADIDRYLSSIGYSTGHDGLNSLFSNALSAYKNGGQQTLQTFLDGLGSGIGGAVTGGKVAGPVGALVGGLIGLGIGAYLSKNAADKKNQEFLNLMQKYQFDLDKYMNDVLTYVKNKRSSISTSDRRE